MKISLIIPVYNVESYLGKCLDTVESQTYKDSEVIIVNDGSTDNSLEIIEKYVARNKNFQNFTIKNSGLGGARNYGLTKATGEYVVFLDSDDYISSDCLEKFAKAAKESNSDIIVCNSVDVDEQGNVVRQTENNINNGTVTLAKNPNILFNRFCAWGKMYRRSLFDGLEFQSRVWYEDLRLVPKLYLKANNITYIEDVLFYYLQRAGSIMNNTNAARNIEIIEAFEDVITYFKKVDAYETYKSELEYLVLEHLAVAAVTRVVLCKGQEKRRVLRELEKYLATFSELYTNKYIDNLGRNKKLIAFLNKRGFYFLTRLCMKIKNMKKR